MYAFAVTPSDLEPGPLFRKENKIGVRLFRIKTQKFENCVKFQIKNYGKLECSEERRKLARDIYDKYIMQELLSNSYVSFTHSTRTS